MDSRESTSSPLRRHLYIGSIRDTGWATARISMRRLPRLLRKRDLVRTESAGWGLGRGEWLSEGSDSASEDPTEPSSPRVLMADSINALGVIKWSLTLWLVSSVSLDKLVLGALLSSKPLYFFIHYLFAGQTASVCSTVTSAFLGCTWHLKFRFVRLHWLAYNTNLNGALTHYSSGQLLFIMSMWLCELRDPSSWESRWL
nr:dicarboxylate transporter 2.1, chloroplastic-like [Ipomoea batatas]